MRASHIYISNAHSCKRVSIRRCSDKVVAEKTPYADTTSLKRGLPDVVENMEEANPMKLETHRERHRGPPQGTTDVRWYITAEGDTWENKEN